MRRDTLREFVNWEVDLAQSEHDAFQRVFPVKGTYTSVIAIGLQHFLDTIEIEPMLQVWAHEDIAQHLHNEERPVRRKNLSVTVPTPLYKRFNNVLPEWGATSWFIRRLVGAIIAADTVPLQRQVINAVDSFLHIVPQEKQNVLVQEEQH